MMNRVEAGLIEAARIGREEVKVSHIQYVDDAMFTVEGSRENARALKWLLMNFELVSGLSVNFDKSCIYGINMEDDLMGEVAEILGCQIGEFPITYLGMRVGGKGNGVAGWADVVEKVKNRLRGWDLSKLSLGGRITLVNSILSAMPIYRLSFSPMPKAIANQVRSLQCNFLWGGKLGSRKRALIKWDTLCREKKDGGLGIKDLMCFNKTLLSKWVWNFLNGEDKLWIRIVKSRHGNVVCDRDGIRIVGGGNRSGWWGKMISLLGGENGTGFWGKCFLRLGAGDKARFWEGRWSGEESLRNRFPRLYNLCLNKEAMVGEMGTWVDGRWRWGIQWRRNLLDREEGAAEELNDFLQNFELKQGEPDRWCWGGVGKGELSVKEVYKEMMKGTVDSRTVPKISGGIQKIWKMVAPFKALVMAWRLIWNKLPTCDNLIRFLDIPLDETGCRCCNSQIETADHFFLHCPEVVGIWQKMADWIGVRWAAPGRIADHFSVFTSLLGGGKRRRRLGGLWVCVVWVLWKWRNSMTFNSKEWNGKRIEEEIKCRFWSWSSCRGEEVETASYLVWTSSKLHSIWIDL